MFSLKQLKQKFFFFQRGWVVLLGGSFATLDKDGKQKSISATSTYFNSRPYFVNETTCRIDYDRLERDAAEFKPNLIISGYSGHTRDLCVAVDCGGRGVRLMSVAVGIIFASVGVHKLFIFLKKFPVQQFFLFVLFVLFVSFFSFCIVVFFRFYT